MSMSKGTVSGGSINTRMRQELSECDIIGAANVVFGG